jgi:hypothetical protein
MGIEPTSKAWEAYDITQKHAGLAAFSHFLERLNWKIMENGKRSAVKGPITWLFVPVQPSGCGLGMMPRPHPPRHLVDTLALAHWAKRMYPQVIEEWKIHSGTRYFSGNPAHQGLEFGYVVIFVVGFLS